LRFSSANPSSGVPADERDREHAADPVDEFGAFPEVLRERRVMRLAVCADVECVRRFDRRVQRDRVNDAQHEECNDSPPEPWRHRCDETGEKDDVVRQLVGGNVNRQRADARHSDRATERLGSHANEMKR
jgi:hypothetical protein